MATSTSAARRVRGSSYVGVNPVVGAPACLLGCLTSLSVSPFAGDAVAHSSAVVKTQSIPTHSSPQTIDVTHCHTIQCQCLATNCTLATHNQCIDPPGAWAAAHTHPHMPPTQRHCRVRIWGRDMCAQFCQCHPHARLCGINLLCNTLIKREHIPRGSYSRAPSYGYHSSTYPFSMPGRTTSPPSAKCNDNRHNALLKGSVS